MGLVGRDGCDRREHSVVHGAGVVKHAAYNLLELEGCSGVEGWAIVDGG